MSGIWFDPEILGNVLSETAGYKSGLALSIEEMCDLLTSTGFADTIQRSETNRIRLRSEEYGELFHHLLYKVGYAKSEYTGVNYSIALFHKYKGTEHEGAYNDVTQLQIDMWSTMEQNAIDSGADKLDPTPYLEESRLRFGLIGAEIALERLQGMIDELNHSPLTSLRYREWESIESLTTLFKGAKTKPEDGEFIDQRFLDYLHMNGHKLGQIHWRKFEELTAEYFHREGYKVELGPGSGDDGVDVRVWKTSDKNESNSELTIIQCKRQKNKIEKVVVKGPHAHMQHYNANLGLVVTTSELSPGAKETIRIRSYPIEEVDSKGVTEWLAALQKTGSGVMRC